MGAPYNYPQQLGQNDYQYRDDLFWLKGGHSFKVGADYLHNVYSGNFGQNVRGTVLAFSSGVSSLNLASIFPTWNDPSTWNIAALSPYATSFTQGFGNYNYSLPTNAMGVWFEDDWKVSPKLTLNLGLRYDNDLGIFNPNLTLKSGVETPHYNDNLLFQPRVGFAWDPTGSRKTVIRGGAGLFYADIQVNQTIDDQIFNGQTTISPAIQGTAANPINLLDPWGGVTGDQFLSGAVPVNAQTIQPLGPHVQTPYSLQMSIGIARQLNRSWSLSADYIHWRVYHDWLRTDANLFYNPVTGYTANPSTAGRPNPSFVGILNFTTPAAAGSLYDGMHVGVTHRFSQSFSVVAAYTLAHLKDSTTSPFYYPNNQFNLADEWAVSPDNQTNTLTIAGSYAWKWGIALERVFPFRIGAEFPGDGEPEPVRRYGSDGPAVPGDVAILRLAFQREGLDGPGVQHRGARFAGRPPDQARGPAAFQDLHGEGAGTLHSHGGGLQPVQPLELRHLPDSSQRGAVRPAGAECRPGVRGKDAAICGAD